MYCNLSFQMRGTGEGGAPLISLTPAPVPALPPQMVGQRWAALAPGDKQHYADVAARVRRTGPSEG